MTGSLPVQSVQLNGSYVGLGRIDVMYSPRGNDMRLRLSMMPGLMQEWGPGP